MDLILNGTLDSDMSPVEYLEPLRIYFPGGNLWEELSRGDLPTCQENLSQMGI